MQLIIETDDQYAPMFRAVAKAVKAKVRTNTRSKPKKWNADSEGPFIEEGIALPGEKPSDFFKGAWAKDAARTAKSIREAAWKRKG